MQPQRYPGTHDTIRHAHSVMLVASGNRRRQLLFLPGLVIKMSIGAAERAIATREARNAERAARHRFWRDLALPVHRVPFLGRAMRRHDGVRLEDYAALDRRMVALLDRAQAWPDWRPLWHFLRASRHVRSRLPDTATPPGHLAGTYLPMTSMHGDLHMFNFVRKDGGFGLLDWEHFVPEGSFLYDFLDFRLANVRMNAGRDWYDFLADLTPAEPAIAFVARRLGIHPEALLIYYTIAKIDALVARRGGLEGLAPHRRSKVEALLAAQARAAGA